MNSHMSSPEEAIHLDVHTAEKDILAQWGFVADEIASLLWLRQWYQSGGSDRALMVRQLEFLKLLVTSGELEL